MVVKQRNPNKTKQSELECFKLNMFHFEVSPYRVGEAVCVTSHNSMPAVTMVPAGASLAGWLGK